MEQLLNSVTAWLVYALWALAIVFCLLALCVVSRWLYATYRDIKTRTVLLEITPHARGDKVPEATNQLFKSLYTLGQPVSLIERIMGYKAVFSLEIIATNAEGIRYLVRCNDALADTFQHIVQSYSSEVKVKNIGDYIGSIKNPKILEFVQSTHFAYPLQQPNDTLEHDPVGYVTNAMAKLDKKELMAFQLVIRPTISRQAEIINHRIMRNENLMPKLHGRSVPIVGVFGNVINTVLFGMTDIVSEIVSGGGARGSSYRSYAQEYDYKRQVARQIKPARTLTYFEHEMVESISRKLSQQLFKVNIRVLIDATDGVALSKRKRNIESALNVYSVPKYQKMRLCRLKYHFGQKLALFNYKHRIGSFLKTSANIFAVSEIASMYHFPNTVSAKTDNVVKSLSKTLPAPLSLKGNTDLDVIIGMNIHHGVSTPIGLTKAERERHMYIIGGTGNGKTTMMEYAIVQDIQNGKGVAVIDPHGDLAEKLLGYIPEERIKDVIYFNPSDLQYPIGLNLLELPDDLDGDDLINARDFITEAVISVMRKVFSDDDSGGHRIEYVLRNTVQTALTQKDATLFTIYDLLTDGKYRGKVVRTLQDQKLRNFWKNEFGKAGAMQKVKMGAGVTAKIGRFQFSASAERILSQPRSTINFNEILDGKILICNLAKGLIGEDTSELFGISILAKLQLAAYQRVKTKRDDRRPFYIYVDEFQNFATMSFVQLLSEARKYKVFLTMAEQSTSQQEEQRMVNTIFANVGTVICFRSGNPADETMVLPLFQPYVQAGEIANLPTYNFYARLAAIHSQEPMSGETLLLESTRSDAVAERVIETSREYWGSQKTPESKESPIINSVDHEHIETTETINIPKKL